MTNTIHINFWPRQSRSSKEFASLQIRVTLNKTRTELGSTGFKIKRAEWSQKGQKVKGTSPLSTQLNTSIDNVKAEIMAVFNDYETKKRVLSADRLKSLVSNNGKPIYTMARLLDYYILTNPKLTGDTSAGYRRRFNKVFKFDKNVSPDEINPIFLNNYEKFLSNDLGYKESYVYKCMASLKMVMDEASSHGLIDQNDIKATSLSFKREYDTSHLSMEEVNMLLLHKSPDEAIQKALDMYLFCCFTGLSYIDYSTFNPSQIEDQDGTRYIRGRRQKTKSEYFLPLYREAEYLLNKYEGHLPRLYNQSANKLIKIGMLHAGIKRKMKFHSGRKTFANYCINHLLLTKETTAKMMGQVDIKELDAYANTTETRVINETKRKPLKSSVSGWFKNLIKKVA